MMRGDVVLAHLPFVGTSGGKVRPALVVQSDVLNQAIQETVIVEITSNLAHASSPHQVLVDIATQEGAASGLIMNSAVRCNRLHIIPQIGRAVNNRQVVGWPDAPSGSRVESGAGDSMSVFLESKWFDEP